MYRERTPILLGLALALPLTLLSGFPLFMLTGQVVGRFEAGYVIWKFALAVYAVCFFAVYGIAAARLRRKHGLPVLQFSLRRLLVCVALVGAHVCLSSVPRVQRWTDHGAPPDAPTGLREYGWPLLHHCTALLVSGGEAPDFRVGALAFNIVFILLFGLFVLSLRIPREQARS